MEGEPLRHELKVLLVQRLRLRDVAPETIGDEDPLAQGPLGLDSLDLLELALAVDQAYGVKLPDEQLAQQALQSIATLADFVERSRAGIARS
jgi:acyl carrier protein